MSSFKPTTVSTLPAVIEPLSESAKFWKNNIHPAIVFKELNSINSIDINVQNEIITTSATKISLYDPSSSEKRGTFIPHNHASLYCGTFRRANSKIFAAGSSDGIIRLWDCKKPKPLRLLGTNDNSKTMKHNGPVHRVNFNGMNQIFSCGDDKDIKLWDFAENSILSKFGGDNHPHEDYIRASCFVESTSSFVSGSYDHTVKIWDYRAPKSHCFKYAHQHPVESITYRDLLVISASGTTIQVFDMVAGKSIQTLDNIHHKTITCVHNHGGYLMTASIDGHLKIYDINFNVVASFSYQPSQLLSCTFNGQFLAVGTNDGILSVNKVSKTKHQKKEKRMHERAPTNVSDQEMCTELFFNSIPSKKKPRLDLRNTCVVQNKKVNFQNEKHEQLLKKFKYSDALNRVMRIFSEKDPEKVVNFIQELIRRNGLKSALAGKTILELKKMITFLVSNLGDLRFTRILLDASTILVDIYSKQIHELPKLKNLFKELNECIDNEINCLQKMSEISGQLQFLINSHIK